MFKKILFIVLVVLPFTVYGADTEPNDIFDRIKKTFPVREGYPIRGIDGVLSFDEENKKWEFEMEDDFTDGFGLIKACEKVEILKSSMLEKMKDIYENKDVNEFRIWGSAVEYRRENSVFPMYFLPLTAGEKQQEEKKTEQTQEIADANKDGILPEDIMEKLQPRRAVTTAQVSEALQSEDDAVVVNRTGIVFYDALKDRYVFKLDSLGRNVDDVAFVMHKSRVLEYLRREQRKSPSQMRFEVSGRITQFDGRRYILMHKANRAWDFGNFGK